MSNPAPEIAEDLALRLSRRGGCDNLHCGDSSPCHDCRGCDIRALSAELAKVRQELEAAVEMLRDIAEPKDGPSSRVKARTFLATLNTEADDE